MIGRLVAGSLVATVMAGATVPTYLALEAGSAQAVLVASAQNLQEEAGSIAQLDNRPATSADLVTAVGDLPPTTRGLFTITVSGPDAATLATSTGAVCITEPAGSITEGDCT